MTTDSDKLVVNFDKTKDSLTIAEAMGGDAGGIGSEDKQAVIFDKGKGLPKFGYVLLCEGVAACGPKSKTPFKGVSDLLISGISLGTKKPALFFYSDASGTLDPDFVKKLDKGDFLGQVKETGKPQNLGKFFGAPATSVIVTSDGDPIANPEPSSLTLLGIGTLGLLGCGWRRFKPAK
jgi:hypothetical protein